MKIKQTYVRTFNPAEASYASIRTAAWYPVTKAGVWGGGRIVNNNGEVYYIDLHSVEVCPYWEIKTVEVEL